MPAYIGYQFINGSKAAKAWHLPPTQSSSEVEERVEVYISAPHLHVHGML
jgi:hypothetical protein